MISEYWLANEFPDKVVSELEKFHGEQLIWGNSPLINMWLRNYASYYSPVLEPNGWESSLLYTGEQGELIKMAVPQARQLTRHMVSIVTKQRLDFQAITGVTTQSSIDALKLGNALGTYIVDKSCLNDRAADMVEQGMVLGESFLVSRWRTDRGKPAGDDGERVLYTGEHEISVHSIFDLFYDPQITAWEDHYWIEVRVKRNRWDLIAQHPELRDRLLQIPPCNDLFSLRTTRQFHQDLIWVYELYARPTPALPEGRFLAYAGPNCVIIDGPNYYGFIPAEQFKPATIFGTANGYAPFSDLLPCQEMFDACISAAATNNAAFGVQNVLAPRNSNIGVQDIQGMNWISYTPQDMEGGGKPEALNLTKTAPETYKFAEMLKGWMTEISQINAVLRGELPNNLSGVAIATLTANALEFISSTSKLYQRTLENTMAKAIRTYEKFAGESYTIQVVGPSNQARDISFAGDELAGLDQVKMIVQNPLMQTIAGRVDIAEKLIESGLIKNAQEYISILEGRSPQTLYRTELSENDLIDIENEKLLRGEPVVVIGAVDDHPRHMREHAGLLNDLSVRMDGNRANVIMEHVLEHFTQLRIQDPMLMAIIRTGQMPQGAPAGSPGHMGPQPTDILPGGSAPGSLPEPPAPDVAGVGGPAITQGNVAKDLLQRSVPGRDK